MSDTNDPIDGFTEDDAGARRDDQLLNQDEEGAGDGGANPVGHDGGADGGADSPYDRTDTNMGGMGTEGGEGPMDGGADPRATDGGADQGADTTGTQDDEGLGS